MRATKHVYGSPRC